MKVVQRNEGFKTEKRFDSKLISEGIHTLFLLSGLDSDQLEVLKKGFEGFDKEGTGRIRYSLCSSSLWYVHNVSNIEWNLISRCESISTTAIGLTHFVDIYSYTCVVFVIFSRTTMQMILKSMVRIDKDVVESVIQVSSGTGADTEF